MYCFLHPILFTKKYKMDKYLFKSIIFKETISFLLLLFMIVIFTNDLMAQPDTELPSDQVEVVKNFEARLADAEKVDISPTLPNIDTSTQTLNYSVPPNLKSIDYEPPVLRPIAMKPDPLPEIYKMFGKVGYGLPNSPFVEISYDSGIQNNLDFGAWVKHHSANNKNQLENQRFGNTDLELDGTYYFDYGFAVQGIGDFSNRNVYYYGYDHTDTIFMDEDVKQTFTLFDIGGKFFNHTRTVGDLNYSTDINFYRQNDAFKSNEFGIILDAELTKYFAEKHPLTIQIKNDFSTFKDSTSQDLNNLSLIPSFTFQSNSFYGKAGVNLSHAKDTFHLFPNVELGYLIPATGITIFAGWDGGLIKNSFRRLSEYNPYIVSEFDVKNTKLNNIYAGIKGQSGSLNYEARAGYKITENTALFLNDYAKDGKRFNVIYDDVDIFNLHGEITYSPFANLNTFVLLDFNALEPETENKAWHLPIFELNVGANGKMFKEKFGVKAELYLASGVANKNENDSEEFLGALLDLSLGADYQFTKNFGVFLDVNNITDNKRERWYRYPSFGINFLGGIIVKI